MKSASGKRPPDKTHRSKLKMIAKNQFRKKKYAKLANFNIFYKIWTKIEIWWNLNYILSSERGIVCFVRRTLARSAFHGFSIGFQRCKSWNPKWTLDLEIWTVRSRWIDAEWSDKAWSAGNRGDWLHLPHAARQDGDQGGLRDPAAKLDAHYVHQAGL